MVFQRVIVVEEGQSVNRPSCDQHLRASSFEIRDDFQECGVKLSQTTPLTGLYVFRQ
jgi:hypothetical protein